MSTIKMNAEFPENLFDKHAVAKFLRCSIRQVDYLRQREGLPFVKIGALIRFFPTHLDEWCKSRVQNAANATGVSKVEKVSTSQNPETELKGITNGE